MNLVKAMFHNSQVRYLAHAAYLRLQKHHDSNGMQVLCDYLDSVGLGYDASNNQLTFWSKSSRSPFKDRIVFEMQGPQDPMLARNHTSVHRTVYYVSYYLAEDDVAAIQREMDNEPDKLEDARALLKDRASDQDPALRGRPISTSIPQ
jgi:predicted glutamine amidotransferase